MSARTRTWVAVGGVVLLAGLWWASGHLSPTAQQRSFRERIARIDTGALKSFTIVPALQRRHPEMHFERGKEGWTLTSAGYHTPPDPGPLQDLLTQLTDLRTLRVVGKMAAVKDLYSLSDSTADHLLLDTPDGKLDITVGDLYGGEEAATVVHPGDDAEVYAVRGDLGMLMDKSYMDWIPKPMVNGDPRNWKRLTFVFPGSRMYVMERSGDQWTVAGHATDSVKVAHYLRNLSRYSGTALVDPADTLDAVLTFNLTVEDTTRSGPIMLGIFQTKDHMIARSTLAPPNIVMAFDPKVELQRLFRMPTAFFPDSSTVNR